MPFLAEEFIDIPNKDLLSWMFDNQQYDPDKPVRHPFSVLFVYVFLRTDDAAQVYVDAAEPERTINSNQARSIIRKLCAGFKDVGLKEGDCVCMLSFNDVRH